MWDKAKMSLNAMRGLVTDDGWQPVSSELVDSALLLMNHLKDCPQDVYPLPDGSINLEWQHADDSIERISVDEVGVGEHSISYPMKPMVFTSRFWDENGLYDKRPDTV